MTDPNLCQPALRRRSVIESDNVPMNGTANPQIKPSQFIPRGKLNLILMSLDLDS